jgi:hypothetical protein
VEAGWVEEEGVKVVRATEEGGDEGKEGGAEWEERGEEVLEV